MGLNPLTEQGNVKQYCTEKKCFAPEILFSPFQPPPPPILIPAYATDSNTYKGYTQYYNKIYLHVLPCLSSGTPKVQINEHLHGAIFVQVQNTKEFKNHYRI